MSVARASWRLRRALWSDALLPAASAARCAAVRKASAPTTAQTVDWPAPMRLAASLSNMIGLSPIGAGVWNRCAGAMPSASASLSGSGFIARNEIWSTTASESTRFSQPPPFAFLAASSSALRKAAAISPTGSRPCMGSAGRSLTWPTPTMTGMRAGSLFMPVFMASAINGRVPAVKSSYAAGAGWVSRGRPAHFARSPRRTR